jgi:hypothetical protein
MLLLILAVGAAVGLKLRNDAAATSAAASVPQKPSAASLIPPPKSADLIGKLQGSLTQLPGIGPAAAAAVGLGAASAKLVAATGGNTATEVAAFLNPAGLIAHGSGVAAKKAAALIGGGAALQGAAYDGAAVAGGVAGWATMTAGPLGTVLAAPFAVSAGALVAGVELAPAGFHFAVSGAKSVGNALSVGASDATRLANDVVATGAKAAAKAATSVEHAVENVASHLKFW